MDKLDKMWALYMDVKMDPYKFIGEPNVNKLEAFYWGMSRYFERTQTLICYRLDGFKDFLINEKCNDTRDTYNSAYDVLLRKRESKEAFYLFYELIEKFLVLQGESYEPLCIRKPREPLTIYEGGPTKIIWGIVNNERTKIDAGGISLELLEAYINGVIFCAMSFEDKSFELMPGFDEYLQNRFQAAKEKNRYQIVQENSVNDKEAFTNYYLWMRDFLEIKGPDYSPVVVKI